MKPGIAARTPNLLAYKVKNHVLNISEANKLELQRRYSKGKLETDFMSWNKNTELHRHQSKGQL